jgi:hypothetical protein
MDQREYQWRKMERDRSSKKQALHVPWPNDRVEVWIYPPEVHLAILAVLLAKTLRMMELLQPISPCTVTPLPTTIPMRTTMRT